MVERERAAIAMERLSDATLLMGTSWMMREPPGHEEAF
jgi:hypothetical protein